jgi:hypothetical protein
MLANSIPGAIIENNLDITHPLSFGLGKKYYSLKTGDKIYSLLKGANNVAYVPKIIKAMVISVTTLAKNYQKQ